MNKHIEKINITQESVDDFLRSPEIKRLLKVFKHMLRGYKPIKRTRKRQIAKAKHMMACHDQRVMSGHSGGSKELESLKGGRIMTLEEMIKDAGLDPKTVNKAVKDFQKAGEKYNGIQCAVAMTLLLRLLVQNDSQRQMVNDIANEYDIGTEEE